MSTSNRSAGARRRTAIAKRLFDLVIASAALVLLSPILLAIAVLVRVRLGSPIIFRQQRPGLGGRPFTLY
jgi:sugar transferase EpsL